MVEKKKEYTPNQLAFFEALVGDAEGDIPTAIKLAGYSESTKVTDIIKSLRGEIKDLSKGALELHSVKAAFALISLLRNPNQEGASNLIKVAELVLKKAGVGEDKDDLKLNIPQGGLIILPAKGAKVELEHTNEEAKVKTIEDGENQPC